MPLDLHLPDKLNAWVRPDLVEDPAGCPPIRWGIMGAGNIARTFATDVRATGARVTLVGSRSADRASRFAAENGVPAWVEGYEALVNSPDVDAVYVATPHSEHRDCALLALAAGKHVLVEKSFTRTAAEAQEVFDAARASGLFAMEAMWSRFLPHYLVTSELLRNGALGEISQIAADHGQAISHVPRLYDPTLAGGALLDLGVYPISFVHFLLGKPQQVAVVGTPFPTGVDASSVVALGYPTADAVATSTMVATTASSAWVAATRGRVEFAPRFYAPGPLTVHLADAEPIVWDAGVEGGFQFEIAEASRCIEKGLTESTMNPWQDTLEVMALLNEARHSIASIV